MGEGRGACCPLPPLPGAQNPSQPGTLQEPCGDALAGPVWPPPPASSRLLPQSSSLSNSLLSRMVGSSVGRRAWGDSVLREALALHSHPPGPPQSPTSPGPRDPAVGGGRRPGCSGTFCMSPKSRPILPGQHHPGHPGGPATATALGIHVQPGHGPRGGDTRVRTASAKHSTSRSPVGQPSGSPRVGCGAQTAPPTSWTPSRSPQYVREGGGGACRERRGQTGQWPCWLSAFGAPVPAGPLGPQEPFVVWHFTHSRASPPLLSRQIPSVLPPRTAPFPLPRRGCWAPRRCHPGRSRPPCPESSSPLQRPCKSRFG